MSRENEKELYVKPLYRIDMFTCPDVIATSGQDNNDDDDDDPFGQF